MYGMLYRTNHRFGPLLPLPAVNVRTFQAVLQILTKAYIVGEDRCPTLKVSPNSEVIFWHLLPSKAEPIKLKIIEVPSKLVPTTEVHVRYR